MSAFAGTDPWAPFESPRFETVSTNSGLPHSVTTSVVQDTRGLIWVGTMGGLVRYDGLHTQVFDSRKNPPQGLPDAYVRALMALPDGGLLIGTNAAGLVRFHPADNSFSTWPVGSGGTSSAKIYAFSSDHNGGVWIATDSGLDHLDLANGKLRKVRAPKATSGRNFTVFQDRSKALWVGNQRGLSVRRAGSNTFVPVHSADPAIDRVLSSPIWAIGEDDAGRLWFGSLAQGAVYRDAKGAWHPVPGYFSRDPLVQWPTVRAIASHADGATWLATDGYGTVRYQPGATHSRRIRHDPAIATSLPGDTVRALLFDRTGNLWIATNLGLAVTHPGPHVAFSILPSPSNPRGLSGSNVHNVFIDSRRRIWLGLDSGRIDVIDLARGSMRHLRLGNRQAHRDVMAFLEMPDGSIWAGSDGLTSIDPDSMQMRGSVIETLDDKPVLSLARDGNKILIGTYEGVYVYDWKRRTLRRFSHETGDPSSLVNDTVHQIERIGDTLWLTTAHGISTTRAGLADLRFRNLLHAGDDATSLPQNYVNGISQDQQGNIWISTFGGLVAAGPLKKALSGRGFRTYTTLDGLTSNKVNASVADDNGLIWTSVSNGINVLNPKTGTVQTLGRRNGLSIDSYVNVAAARTSAGDLLFGGLGGLTVVRPDLASRGSRPGPLVVTNARLGTRKLPFGVLPTNGDTITIGAKARNMRVDFALLDYLNTRQTRYSYRLDGLDRGWNTVTPGNIPSAIYTNLPHGDYTLILRAEALGLQAQQIESRLHITVQPLWYETVTARLAGIMLLLALMVGLVYLRTWMLHRRARDLQAQINASTRELREANARLDHLAGTDSLTGVYNRRRFLELVEQRLRRAPDQKACMALLDLDHFKQVNDTHGHLVGDQVLKSTAAIIGEHCRVSDLIGRFGGEELMICMPGTRIEDARKVAERIRKAHADAVIEHHQHSIRITISIGIAPRKHGESVETWLSRADAALYRAKNGGRNRTVVDQWAS